MSIVRFVTIDCDADEDCMESYDSGTTSAREARRMAAANDWRYFRSGAVHGDVCPIHALQVASR